MKRALVLAGLLLGLSAPAWGLEEQIKNFRGIRSSGMGGLLTTTGNYSEALFGNPARLSEVDTWKWTILEVLAEANTNILTDSSKFSNIRGTSGASTISGASDLIGRNEHFRLQFLTAYYNPQFIGQLGFGLGILATAHTNLTVNFTTDIDTQTFVDAGPVMGFSHPFLDNTLSVGMNLRLLYRVASDQTISSLDFLTGGKLSLQNFGKQGFGFDTDIGAYYHVPWEIPFMRISLGMSANNLVKSHYDEIEGAFLAGVGQRPPNNDRILNAGMRFDFPDFWWFRAPLFAFEFQDTGGTQKRISFAKKTHIGGEAKLTRVLSFRLGLNQGYGTLGLGIDLPLIKLDFATYGEELAGNAGQAEDRRLVFRLAFEL